MTPTLHDYFERELLAIRGQAHDFARAYPATAARLLLEPGRSADPHVERLIESFAYLTARIHKKLDDDFPELTDALLGQLYPHYLAPIPSMAIVEFQPQPASVPPEGLRIARGARLHSERVDGVACTFRTAYDVELWPVEIRGVRLQTPPFDDELPVPPGTAAVLRMELECGGELRFDQLALKSLRLHLAGDRPTRAMLYTLLMNHARRLEFRGFEAAGPRTLVTLDAAAHLRAVGFAEDEALLPYPETSFVGYRLLTELFALDEKFLFVDVSGFDRAAAAGAGRRMELVWHLDQAAPQLELSLQGAHVRLGATPIVNLFEKICEPVAITGRRYEYPVVPDSRHPRGYELHSITSVTSVDPLVARTYRPVYSMPHDTIEAADEADQACWYAARRPSTRAGDRGTDVYLHLVDRNFQPRRPADAAVTVRALCTNRDLPQRLRLAGREIDFDLEAAMPLKRIVCLEPPTAPLRPGLGRHAQWRLVSHLSLNHLSLAEGPAALAALKELLALYDFSEASHSDERAVLNQQAIEGLVGLESRPAVARVGTPPHGGLCRGTEVTLRLDPQKYIGLGAFLFASVLERFLPLYATINSFTRLVAERSEDGRTIRTWPPRAGETPLV